MAEILDDAAGVLARAGLPPPLARPGGNPHAATEAEDDFAPLLQATSPAALPGAGAEAPRLRRRLFGRVAASAAAARAMHTQRHADTVAEAVAPGVSVRTLYRAAPGRPRRPGEPDAVALVELAPGASWLRPAPQRAGLQDEWLVVRGRVRFENESPARGASESQRQVDDEPLGTLDFHVRPASAGEATLSSAHGALLFLRQALPVPSPEPGAPARAFIQRAEAAAWHDYAPGILRRVLWRQGAQAAMLYHARPGAAVPRHGHGHDEECLMLAGDFFLDEVLLRPLDYQIAPAGSEHQTSNTDTGVILYAHGDFDLDVK